MSDDNASTKTDLRIERSREALRAALFELIKTNPYESISIRDVTAAAGVGYATFFRHYHDKRALLNDLVANETEELFARALPVFFAKETRAACLTLCDYVDERREIWSGLLTGGAAGVMREEFLRHAQRAASESNFQSEWPPIDLKIIFGVSGAIEVIAWWLRAEEPLGAPDVADILDRLVVAPMLEE